MQRLGCSLIREQHALLETNMSHHRDRHAWCARDWCFIFILEILGFMASILVADGSPIRYVVFNRSTMVP